MYQKFFPNPLIIGVYLRSLVILQGELLLSNVRLSFL